MPQISRITMGKIRKTFLILIAVIFCMGLSYERQLQLKIQEQIKQAQLANSQPKPLSDRRAARQQMNRYYTKTGRPGTIFPEPAPPGKPAYKNSRFYGGIPRRR
jgi:hypothetical protein